MATEDDNEKGVQIMHTLIDPKMMQGELRILDTDLAERLGFERPRDIRKLIKRYEFDLAKMGVCATVAQTSGEAGGRPAAAYYLNKKQAIFITAKSDTVEATAITIEIIERFDAYERGGENGSFKVPTPMREAPQIAIDAQDRIEALESKNAALTPKASVFDKCMDLDGLYGLQQSGRILQQKPNLFIGYLKTKWLFYQGGQLIPRSEFSMAGQQLFDVKWTV